MVGAAHVTVEAVALNVAMILVSTGQATADREHTKQQGTFLHLTAPTDVPRSSAARNAHQRVPSDSEYAPWSPADGITTTCERGHSHHAAAPAASATTPV